MKLVEKTIVKKSHHLYQEIDHLAFLSKNLYNAGLYLLRQAFFKREKILSGFDLVNHFSKSKQPDYVALPRKVSQWVLFQLNDDFQSFFKALKSWKINPSKFKAKPQIPRYKDKIKGRNLLTYDKQALSIKGFKKGLLQLSGSKIEVSTRTTLDNILQVKIAQRANCYVICAIYNAPDVQRISNSNVASIDLGINNLAALAFNNGDSPLLINGKPLKSINQYYNKKKALLTSALMKQDSTRRTSNKINRLTFKRNNKVHDCLHKASRYIINQLVSRNISQLVVGYNPGWKQEINIGSQNNQNFVQIPFLQFMNMLEYKCQLVGISFLTHEESYTSKCSFLDLESVEKHESYQGSRIKRGLFRSANGTIINADVNGSYNIMRKAIPNAFANGIEAVAVQPISVSI